MSMAVSRPVLCTFGNVLEHLLALVASCRRLLRGSHASHGAARILLEVAERSVRSSSGQQDVGSKPNLLKARGMLLKC